MTKDDKFVIAVSYNGAILIYDLETKQLRYKFSAQVTGKIIKKIFIIHEFLDNTRVAFLLKTSQIIFFDFDETYVKKMSFPLIKSEDRMFFGMDFIMNNMF